MARATSEVDLAQARAIVREKARREKFPAAVAGFVAGLFPAQRKLVEDKSKRIVTHAGRRGGKTHALDGKALATALLFPGETIPVIERAMQCAAADEFWSNLQELDKIYGLGSKFQHTVRTCTLMNGAKIQMYGADTAESADKIRGIKTPLALVDECGAYRDSILKYLVQDVLEAATIDFDGTIVLAGTPGVFKKGFWYECANTNPGWSVHHWDLLDNPNIGDSREWREQWLRDLRVRNGWTEQSSVFVREYLGRWCESFDDRMYDLADRNIIHALPPGQYDYFLGSDVGVTDPCAFVVWGRREGDNTLYVVESYQEGHLIPSTYAEHVRRLDARYHFTAKCIDAGGLGKAFQQELLRTYGINMEAADKQGKVAAVDAINGDLVSARVKIVAATNTRLIEEVPALPWNDERTDAKRGVADHVADAFLYGGRLVRQWMEVQEQVAPLRQLSQIELWQAEAEAMEAEAEGQCREYEQEYDLWD